MLTTGYYMSKTSDLCGWNKLLEYFGVFWGHELIIAENVGFPVNKSVNVITSDSLPFYLFK